MTRIAGLVFFAAAAAASSLGLFVFNTAPAHAQLPYTVSVAPARDTVPVGEMAVFRVRVEGQTTTLPSFNFDVEGGSLAGVGSIDPTAANVAEGTVFVTRESEGTAKLTVRFGGQALASSQARFARMGTLNITVTLDAGPDAAARTWRYEVVAPSGQVVATLQANTSGDAPSHQVSTQNLPYGFYTIRQVLGNDTRTACAPGTFYRVAAPVGAETTVQLDGESATVRFSIATCPDLPTDLGVIIPIDTLAPAPAGGVVGEADVLPGVTPISEVRGTRQEGPGDPLPPAVGNSPAGAARGSVPLLVVLAVGATMTLVPAAAWCAATSRNRSRR